MFYKLLNEIFNDNNFDYYWSYSRHKRKKKGGYCNES